MRKVGWADESIGRSASPAKTAKKEEAAKPKEVLEDDFLASLGLGGDEEKKPETEAEEEPKSDPVERAREKTKRRKKANEEPATLQEWSDIIGEEGESPTPTKTEAAAERMGVDLATECPVCRSLESCDCEEEDRAFVRRTRFEADVAKVARCPRCQAPLSVLHLPRPGTRPPHKLAHFVAVHGCAVCDGPSLATVALGRT